MKVYPIILAGGKGTRLWPSSTEKNPKQFIKLFSNKSLFQLTIERFKNDKLFFDPIIITNKNYSKIIEKQLREINFENYEIINEPSSKDTAPAICLASYFVHNKDKNAKIILVPSDHYLPQKDLFHSLIEKGLNFLETKILLFGIRPSSPETGYGYIKSGKEIEKSCFEVKNFKEKPDLNTAMKYISTGDYFWNSGIYLSSTKKILSSFEILSPSIFNIIKNLDKDMKQYEELPTISIDYAITEKEKEILMIETDLDWSDVGSWDSLWKIKQKDENGNHHDGDVISLKSKNNLIKTHNKKVITIGIENLAIIETEENILIIDKNLCQEVKTIVKIINE